MAKYPENRYVPGTYKVECDICGFDFLRTELRRNSRGLLVCQADFEEKHPREDSSTYVNPTPDKRRD